MPSKNNYDLGPNYVYCRYGCGVRITFSNNTISKNGRKIPLEENGLPHNCPNSYFNKRRRELRECNNRFIKETENIGPPALVDSQARYLDSRLNQEERLDNGLNKISLEQQLHYDTIGPLIAEIILRYWKSTSISFEEMSKYE
jgi:hypothetical protein